MSKNFCQYCDPSFANPAHIPEKVEVLLSSIIFFLIPTKILNRFPKLPQFINKTVIYGFINILLVTRVLKEVDVSNKDENIGNRSIVIVCEAQKRGFTVKAIKVLGKGNAVVFSMEINGKKKFFDNIPHAVLGVMYSVNVDDKGQIKELLKKNNLPTPYGAVCKNYNDALVCVGEIGFPVVVKPKSGSLSRHTICNIKTEEELIESVRIAKIISREFIVEEFIEGGVYRVIVVDGKVIASCLREPPNVLGDGKHTVLELVGNKNMDPRRGGAHQKNFTLHKIQLDSDRARELLSLQGVDIQTVVPSGKKIYLHDKITLSAGADIHDTTDLIHKDNISLFRKVYDICGVPVIGIDFIIKDISQSYHHERCAVLEINSLPYIDMHHYPMTGLPRDIAGPILDYCISNW